MLHPHTRTSPKQGRSLFPDRPGPVHILFHRRRVSINRRERDQQQPSSRHQPVAQRLQQIYRDQFIRPDQIAFPSLHHTEILRVIPKYTFTRVRKDKLVLTKPVLLTVTDVRYPPLLDPLVLTRHILPYRRLLHLYTVGLRRL